MVEWLSRFPLSTARRHRVLSDVQRLRRKFEKSRLCAYLSAWTVSSPSLPAHVIQRCPLCKGRLGVRRLRPPSDDVQDRIRDDCGVAWATHGSADRGCQMRDHDRRVKVDVVIEGDSNRYLRACPVCQQPGRERAAGFAERQFICASCDARGIVLYIDSRLTGPLVTSGGAIGRSRLSQT